MRLGLLARATKTGLGHQTWEIWRHLNPAVTIVVDHAHRLEDWYGDAPVIAWKPLAELPGAFDLLATCDVVLSVETFYDWTLPERLAERGIPTILIVNPELFDGHWTSHIWNPTTWMMRQGWTHVPHPCPFDRYPEMQPLMEPLRVIHPTSAAMLDRNGYQVARRAWRVGRWIQDTAGPLSSVQPIDYWDRDPGYAASLIPRRYGGLCLPALEAFCAGTPVLMPAVSPNTDWPIVAIPHIVDGTAKMKGGPIQMVDFRTPNVSAAVRQFLSDREFIDETRLLVRTWAEMNSWAALLPRWRVELEKVANTPI